jgi:hypothetical protein
MCAWKKYLAEFIGTFVLVLFGCGTAVVTGCKGSEANPAYLLTALAFGLVDRRDGLFDRQRLGLPRQPGGLAGHAARRQDER